MLHVLERMGLAGRRADVLARMAVVLEHELTEEDRESPQTRPHEEKWQNRASYERAAMVREGLLQDRADGIWALQQ
jgi:hypothetical protein